MKTPYEQKVLTRSVEISAEAHLEGMKAARPGRWEYEVEAAIEYWYMKNGAMSWGYPVDCRQRAECDHAALRRIHAADARTAICCWWMPPRTFQGLTGDITRTYPVNGKFSPAQRDIYDLVLEAQDAGIAAAKLGAPTAGHRAGVPSGDRGGLVQARADHRSHARRRAVAQVSRWFTHGPTHGIGVDVHDPLGQTLVAGSAFVIEPGLYIREAALERPPGYSGKRSIYRQGRPAVQKYKDIGVRIEDSFLMTEAGLVRLSAKAPRQVAEIEKVVGTGK